MQILPLIHPLAIFDLTSILWRSGLVSQLLELLLQGEHILTLFQSTEKRKPSPEADVPQQERASGDVYQGHAVLDNYLEGISRPDQT